MIKETIKLPEVLTTGGLCYKDKFCALGFLANRFCNYSKEKLKTNSDYKTMYEDITNILNIDEKYLSFIWVFNDFDKENLLRYKSQNEFRNILKELNLDINTMGETKRERVISYLNTIPDMEYKFE